ncbi:MAG: Gfo/Idh/MocA family oxidoreductase [Bacteroidia bacterium]
MERRKFLKNSAAAAAGLASISIVPSTVMGRAFGHIAPAEKVNIAFCGIGNRGASIAKSLHKTGMVNVVALCDVDMGAPHTLELMKMFPKVPQFQDFRVMFDKMGKEIEAVSVGTPDFSHFPISMLAMSLGKHVYVEKPMARTFNEVELMINASKKYKVATQMGNQGHSEANYFQFKAWKEAGIIKDVTAITAHMNGRRRWHGFDPNMTHFPKGQALPDTLDWDTWLGTAWEHDYHKDFINGQWRCWYDFGMGALGDWGAHIMDTAHQFLDLGLPSVIDPLKLDGHNPFFFPMASTLLFKFPERGDMPACDITWYDGVENIPEVPEGYGVSELDPNIPPPSNGKLKPNKLNPGKIIYGKDLTFKGGSHGSTLSIIPEEKGLAMASKLPEVPESPSNHFENFILGCKGEEACRSSFDIGGPLSQVFTLGVLAQRMNTRLIFDRTSKRITNNPLANEMLVGAPARKGWEEYYNL